MTKTEQTQEIEKVTIRGVEVTLATPDDHRVEWVDYNEYRLQLEAAWLRLSDSEPPLNPRLIGDPGLGKTTLVLRTCGIRRSRTAWC